MKLEEHLNVFVATTFIFLVELLFSVLLLGEEARGIPIAITVTNCICLVASILCGALAYRRTRQNAMLAQVPVEYTP